MPVPLVVPDALVLLKWVLPSDDEPDTDKALLLRAAIQDEAVHVLLPRLWLFEVGNTIARQLPDARLGLAVCADEVWTRGGVAISTLARKNPGIDPPLRSVVL